MSTKQSTAVKKAAKELKDSYVVQKPVNKKVINKSARVMLYVIYFVSLFVLAVCATTVRASQETEMLFKPLPKPTPEELEKERGDKINKLIAKAIQEDDAVLIQCYNKKCYDIESHIQLVVDAKDGYYLVYPEGTKIKSRIKNTAVQVKEMSKNK